MKNEEEILLEIRKLIESNTTLGVYSMMDQILDGRVYALYVYLPHCFDGVCRENDEEKFLSTPLFITLDSESTISLAIFVGNGDKERRKQIYLIPKDIFAETISDEFLRGTITNEFKSSHISLKKFATKYSKKYLIPGYTKASFITELGTDLVTRRYIVYEVGEDRKIVVPEEVVSRGSDIIYVTKRVGIGNIQNDTIEEYMNSGTTTIKVSGNSLIIEEAIKWKK